jgi:hypothetical protein
LYNLNTTHFNLLHLKSKMKNKHLMQRRGKKQNRWKPLLVVSRASVKKENRFFGFCNETLAYFVWHRFMEPFWLAKRYLKKGLTSARNERKRN